MAQSLWDYAAACYARPGVAEACLALQDRAGADVNLLLAGAWLAARGCAWSSDEVRGIAHLCASWRRHCLLPLREVRRYLKQPADVEALYRQAKALELDAERYQLNMIEEALADRVGDSHAGASAALLRNNLDTCVQLLPGEFAAESAALLEALQQPAG